MVTLSAPGCHPFCLLQNLLLGFWLHFSHLFFCALLFHDHNKPWDLLVNHLLALAKLAIYKSKKEALARRNLGKCGAAFLLFLHSCLQTVSLFGTTGSLNSFRRQWEWTAVFCSNIIFSVLFTISFLIIPQLQHFGHFINDFQILLENDDHFNIALGAKPVLAYRQSPDHKLNSSSHQAMGLATDPNASCAPS